MARFFATLQSLGICLAMVGCGKGKDRTPVDGPTIDVETQLKPRMSPEDVIALLGKPDRDERPKEYPDQEIRAIDYDAYGLELQFHVHRGLGKINVLRRWNNKPVHGYRLGDVIKPGELGWDGKYFCVHFTSETWGEASVYVDDEHDRNGTPGRIRQITLHDQKTVGIYFPRLK